MLPPFLPYLLCSSFDGLSFRTPPLDQLIGYVKKFTEAGVALLAFGIVMQIIFGKVVPFVGGDIIGNITAIVATLGAQGLVGLAAVGVIYAIFTGQQK